MSRDGVRWQRLSRIGPASRRLPGWAPRHRRSSGRGYGSGRARGPDWIPIRCPCSVPIDKKMAAAQATAEFNREETPQVGVSGEDPKHEQFSKHREQCFNLKVYKECSFVLNLRQFRQAFFESFTESGRSAKRNVSIGREPGPPIGVQEGRLCGVGEAARRSPPRCGLELGVFRRGS